MVIRLTKTDGEETTYEMNGVNTPMNEDGLDEVYAMYRWQLTVKETFELYDGNVIHLDIPPRKMQVKECTVSESGFLEGKWVGYFNAGGKYYKVEHILTNWEYVILHEWENETDVDNEKRGNAYCHDRDRKGNMTEVYRYKYISDTEKDYELLYSVYQNVC